MQHTDQVSDLQPQMQRVLVFSSMSAISVNHTLYSSRSTHSISIASTEL